MTPLLSWAEIDALTSADAIAELLRSKGVKGCLGGEGGDCPLEAATGDEGVGYRTRYQNGGLLTEAERSFVRRFDNREWPDLIEED